MAKKKQNSSARWKYIFLSLVAITLMAFAYDPVSSIFSKTNVEVSENGANEMQDDNTPIVVSHSSGENVEATKSNSLSSISRVEIPAPIQGRAEKIIQHKGYTVSLNPDWNIPNWVAWTLTPDRLVEREGRTNKFLPDPAIPASLAVTTSDYSHSGYDRGHMCPAGDNRWDRKAMKESFYMTNMCPQNGNLNRGDWKELEEECRVWAKRYKKIYIVCGPIIYKNNHKYIGKEHKVRVPDAFFKVVLDLESATPKAIGFIYKNNNGNHALDAYVNSVDQVERITGIDFFPSLPDDVENQVESTAKLSQWRR